MARDELSLKEARGLALAAQGFHRPRPAGRIDVRHIRRVVGDLGLLQMDYVNVLVPAHYQVLFSRLGPYNRSQLDGLVYERHELTEQWAHVASIVPVEIWPLLRHRRETHRVRPWGFETVLAKNKEYVRWVLEQVRQRGPLAADDLPEPPASPRRISDRWGWGGAVKRQVLEAYFGCGRLAVTGRRRDFTRVYDLAERVIPAAHRRRHVDREAAQRELLLNAARSHGVATAGDLADYYRMPAREARPRLVELVQTGALREARVEGWRESAYLHPGARQPRRVEAAALLSPFDPLIWTRPRLARLFQFDYRVEIYIPAAKRRWGYYVLPFLLGDRLVARVDLKADRKSRRLLVNAAHRESHARTGELATALARELRRTADWLELDTVAVGRRGDLARPLAACVGDGS
jgi:uncharacterized protein YcaQ